MTATSYAQNFEDVMLLRALRHVERGFYMDIGAQDPVKHSVTKAFYELGWRGINIEPVSHWFRLLEQDRVHDTNLNVAVSDAPGYLRLYEVLDTGLSTTAEAYARRHGEAGFDVQEVNVPCMTLDSLCEANGVGEVHFLKVDCEGAETAVFRGFSFNKVRPWIIVVEATEPLSQKPAYAEWEPILLKHAYQFAYADGLNRFYLAHEHRDLAGAFELPPNVFDAFVPADVVDATRQLELARSHLKVAADVERAVRAEGERDSLRAQLDESSRAVKRLQAEMDQVSRDVNHAQYHLDAMARKWDGLVLENDRMKVERQDLDRYALELAEANHRLDAGLRMILASKSWRCTAPFRFLLRMARGDIGARDAARRVVTWAAGKLARNRLLRVLARALLSPFPGFKDRLRGIARRGLGIEQDVASMQGPALAQSGREIVLTRAAVEALSILHMERDRKSTVIN